MVRPEPGSYAEFLNLTPYTRDNTLLKKKEIWIIIIMNTFI